MLLGVDHISIGISQGIFRRHLEWAKDRSLGRDADIIDNNLLTEEFSRATNRSNAPRVSDM